MEGNSTHGPIKENSENSKIAKMRLKRGREQYMRKRKRVCGMETWLLYGPNAVVIGSKQKGSPANPSYQVGKFCASTRWKYAGLPSCRPLYLIGMRDYWWRTSGGARAPPFLGNYSRPVSATTGLGAARARRRDPGTDPHAFGSNPARPKRISPSASSGAISPVAHRAHPLASPSGVRVWVLATV